MGKSIFFDVVTGAPIKKSRGNNTLRDTTNGNTVGVPSSEISGYQKQEDNLAMEAPRKKRSRNFKKHFYFRSSRKMGTSTFFDEITGLPFEKPRISGSLQYAKNQGDDTAVSVPLAERSIGDFERKQHVFFDIHTGLQIEKSQTCLSLNRTENSVIEPSSEDSQIQEQENISVDAPTVQLSTEVLKVQKKKRGGRKRKMWFYEPPAKPCSIEQLPFEVLEIILSKVSQHDRKNCRLVSRFWYNALCKQNEYLSTLCLLSPSTSTFLKIGNTRTKLRYFENCGLKRLHLHFKDSALSHLSECFWENIGDRIYSLKLENCHLGSVVIQNVITKCKNLQYLKISLLESSDVDETFCLPESLERLDIVRTQLKTFKFCVTLAGNINQKDAERVFAALFRIFPNIQNYSFCLALVHGLPISFKCSFTKMSSTKIADELQLTLMFSLLLSDERADWKKMINVLSSVRLSKVSLYFSSIKLLQTERSVLLDFFASQKELKTVKILPYDSYYNIVKPILFKILDSCCELRELIFCPSRVDDCIQNLTQTEWSTWGFKLSPLKKLSISSFVIDGTSSSLHSFSSESDDVIELRNIFGKSLMSLMPNFTHLEHLILVDNVSDYILQTIFKYLTGLKTLDLRLGVNVTKFGIIGHVKFYDEESMSAYSIDCLKNLERLTLQKPADWPLDDVIFSKFLFPKLTYLNCFLPQYLSAVISLGKQLPSLKTVKFSSTATKAVLTNMLSHFCKNAENLDAMTFYVREDEVYNEEARKFFKVCPTLRTLNCNNLTYYCEPNTRKVALKQPNHLSNNHYFFID